MGVLDRVNNSADLKNLSNEELQILSKEIRNKIIDVTNLNGGHLSSNLGIVETTIALNYVFDFPTDKLIFDVGHQCYTHKILTGRKLDIEKLRTFNGISGFMDKDESQYDTFTTGHAGNSLALGLGLAQARDKVGQDYAIVSVVGDGSFINGLNLEALTSSTVKPKNFIIILNDNGMSISPNNNGFYNYITRMTTGTGYVKSKSFIKKVFRNSFVTKALIGFKNFIKRLTNSSIEFDNFGLKYVGLVDGNNLPNMIAMLKKVKKIAKNRAVLLHIKTTKGKGFSRAEEHADVYHGVGKNLVTGCQGFGFALGEKLNNLIEKDHTVMTITAGMMDGTGLNCVSEKHPENFIDVGIAEEYAVSFSAGLARGGLKPFVCIYSTFLQRAYDQIMHDVCMQNLPVVFCIDRAGLVGEDGKSHQGAFDLSYLSHMPNMTVLCPNNVCELNDCVDYAISLNSPVAIRYPKRGDVNVEFKSLKEGLYQEVYCSAQNPEVSLLTVGPRMLELAMEFSSKSGVACQIISVKAVKPIDKNIINDVKADNIFTLEENSIFGGFGSSFSTILNNENFGKRLTCFGIRDEFVKQGSVEEQLKANDLTIESLLKHLRA